MDCIKQVINANLRIFRLIYRVIYSTLILSKKIRKSGEKKLNKTEITENIILSLSFFEFGIFSNFYDFHREFALINAHF